MRYQQSSSQQFIENRNKLKEQLLPNSVAIFNSNDILPTNADGVMPFKQNANVFYLSNIDQEETILLIAPDFPEEEYREVLFIRETNDEIKTWEGKKVTKEEAKKASGIENVQWVAEFEKIFYKVLSETENIYLDKNEHLRNANQVKTRNDRFIKWCMENYPLYNYHRVNPIVSALRMVKSEEEVKTIRKACDITKTGYLEVLKTMQPGDYEFEIEARYAYQFLKNRSRGFAYQPIVAGGKNACILHYIQNECKISDGDLVLMDVGAEYGNYHADMTRTIPANGRFTDRQRKIYASVLKVKDFAMNILKPGSSIKEYHKAVGEAMEKELVDLGLLNMNEIKNQDKDKPAYKKYFMHGTSHHLGLDVHDVGSIYESFKPGMVLTVEPGIYVRDEGIGIRLEDDVVITADGLINLLAEAPINPDEIEEIMNGN
ncbi:MAG TPA: aminopeptidase P N-terminal domain-containing protein [Cyclobacteriaceae bacterium]